MVEKNQTTKEDKQFDNHGLFAQRLLLVVTSLASLSCCVYYYGAFLQEYFSYPVVLNVKVNNSGIMLFPGVTICNRHRINKHKILNLCYSEDGVRDKSLWRACDTILDDFDLNNLHYTNSYYQGFVSPRSLFITCPRNNDDNTTVQKNQDIVNKVDAYLSLTENQRMEISTSLHEILAKCSYEVSDCYSTSFTTFWSFLYGNCFTFNPKRGMKGRDSLMQTTGAMAGLGLTFGVPDIIGNRMGEEDLRLRLVIHSPHAVPDIENDGIDIALGTSLSVGIEQVDYHRLPEPYSDGCYKDDKNEPGAYNKKQCFQKCLQLLNNETCGCGDPTINLPDGVPPCHLKEANDVCCLDKVMAKLSSDEKTCGCITPCVDYKYTMTISRSSTTWISQKKSRSGDYKYPITISGSSTTWTPMIMSNSGNKFWRVLARVFVYIQTKKRIVYTSNPKYETQNVLSNLGGQLSLWLGISLTFTFKRTLQLMKDIFVKFWKGKRSLKVSPDPSSGGSKNVFVVQQTDVVLLTNTQLGLADIYHI